MKKILLTAGTSLLVLSLYAQSQNWKVTGNAITQGDYLGTSNNEPLIFKANDNEGLRIKPNGELRVKNFDDNLYTGLVFVNTNGVLSKLNFTGNANQVLFGNGTFGSVSSLTGWTLGTNLTTGYNVGIGTTVTPEKLTVDGNILANGSISGTSLNVIDIVTSGKEFKISTSLCMKGIDVNDPLSRNEICGMNGDLYIQSENANYNTIINKGNNGKVGIGTIPDEAFHVAGRAKFDDRVFMNKVVPIDSVFTIGDSTLYFNAGSQNIYGGINQINVKGLGLGVNSYGVGKWSTAMGYKTRASAEGSIIIGGGHTGSFVNLTPYSLFIGFKSNLPTLVVTPGNGTGTTGNVGIATSNPGDRLQVGDDYTSLSFGRADVADLKFGTAYLGFNATRTTSGWLVKTDGSNNGGGIIYGTINGKLIFSPLANTGISNQSFTDEEVYSNAKMVIHPEGGVTIATDCLPAGYSLAVDGKIITEEVNIQVNDENNCWPDYVFDENYELPSLKSVENFTQQNHHLPGVPSANEIETNGMNVSDINRTLLQKTEELTLYLIELDKKMEELKSENEALKKRMEELENNPRK